ncbi:MAG: glycosyltransferase family 2 protein [Armatimonadetes bacterium]|nr:glycosyltransferase family 2 protein [Armatimonadota bacterium]
MSDIELSVVVPVYNEEGCLEELHRRLTAVLERAVAGYEILFVNDGSADRSPEVLRALHRRDGRHVRVLSFSRNFGHEAASTAGMQHARGRAVVLMDADIQDPPEVIPELLERWREGYDLVYAQRASRERETPLKRATSFLYYRVMRRLANLDLPRDTGDFRLMDRKVVDAFNQCRERNRFVRGLICWVGFRQTGIKFHRKPRYAGRTKYNYLKMTGLAVDSLVAFSIIPLRLATLIGAAVGVGSFVLFLAVLAEKLRGGSPQPGYALLGTGILLLGSVQIFLLGVIGEYIGRIYQETQRRPLFLVAEELDCTEREEEDPADPG